MAHNLKSLLTILIISNILLALAGQAVASRGNPRSSKNIDKKQPQFLIDRDGSFLIPGIGRFMIPKKGKEFNPFTYNPVTGTSGGSTGGIGSIGGGTNGGSTGSVGSTGGGSSGSGSGGGASHSYVPGGDDTLLPNPGVEVPNPGSGGSIPAPARP